MKKSVPIQIDYHSGTPLYEQIADEIEKQIEEDALQNGDCLPSVRKLISQLNVNLSTVTSAYRLLERKGLVYTKKGSGTYVTVKTIPSRIPEAVTVTPTTLNLASSAPDPAAYPETEFRKILKEVLEKEDSDIFSYQDTKGYLPLRESMAGYFQKERNIRVKVGNIIVGSGSQQGLNTIFHGLINTGDCIILENPCYTGAKSVFSKTRVFGLTMREDGVDLDEMEYIARKQKPKLFYTSPLFQTPTSYCYSEKKMKEILELARKYHFYIIEDDQYSELDFNRKKQKTMKEMDLSEQVIYLKSFSKILMPGVRIGAIVAPSVLEKKLSSSKHTEDISTSGLLQRGLEKMLREGYLKEHLERIRKYYLAKYRFALHQLERLKKYDIKFTVPNGGMSFWITLPDWLDSFDLYRMCLERGILLAYGDLFYLYGGGRRFMRICYAYCSPEEFRRAVDVILECISVLRTEGNKRGIYL